jgi:predicted PurR-regulated permease PerM
VARARLSYSASAQVPSGLLSNYISGRLAFNMTLSLACMTGLVVAGLLNFVVIAILSRFIPRVAPLLSRGEARL